MRMRTSQTLIVASLVVGLLLFGFLVGRATATSGPTLNVDGVEYSPTKIVGNGETHHYETPDTNPTAAFTDRNTWTGNGSENLPCEGGIHWIDNKNVLTISNCLETETTTTTVETTTTTEAVTTTTEEETTTTTEASTTSTTEQETTTTVVTVPPSTQVDDCPEEERSARGYCEGDPCLEDPECYDLPKDPKPEKPAELPYTGAETWLIPLGVLLLASGGLLVRRANES